MGQLNHKVDDKLEKEFRRVAAERFKARKGFLKKAIEEVLWKRIKNKKRK